MRRLVRERDGRRRIRPGLGADLSARQFRRHTRPDRAGQGDGSRTAASTSRTFVPRPITCSRQSTRRSRSAATAGVPVEIYHLKAAGRRNWPKAAAAIARIAAARDKGLDVGADMYPYVAGSTGLAAVLPPFASAGDKLFERLADPGRAGQDPRRGSRPEDRMGKHGNARRHPKTS